MNKPEPSLASRRAIRTIAFVEAIKGLIVLAAAAGVMSLIRRQDLYDVAAALVDHMHLNPASHYPQIFLDAAEHYQQQAHLLWLAAGAAAYVAVRLTEAYGLLRERAWAEWLAALSGAVYVPFDVLHLLRHPSLLGAAILLVNLAVVGVMVLALMQRRAAASTMAGQIPAKDEHDDRHRTHRLQADRPRRP
ncbi:DUF2127 domain-containing protein [Variovorax dokdonensis]|uniref:DUF2127 domain-containing protein n=1 Tax=Variovorax dokdonensis TaxID=344883 RepID=A0ABT7NGI1_9BURK|nr:DUF2127 domain-containing protein [Variovorax dokdonensis]MDM0047043.1 DUF2127 domain-containing protein [Variovorax dokdonensis]